MKQAAIFLGAFGLILVLNQSAQACSCRASNAPESILKRSAAVFTGVVQRVRPLPRGHSVTTFGIIEAFKGPAAGAQLRVVHRSGSTASCGVRFQPGRTYTLSVHLDPGARDYSTSHCSTWMFSARTGLGERIIRGMRALKGRY